MHKRYRAINPIIFVLKCMPRETSNVHSLIDGPTQFCTRPTAVPIRWSNVHKSIANFMAMIGERQGAAMCRTTSCPGRVCVKKSCIGTTRSLRRIKMQRRPLCFHDMEIYCPETSSAAGYAPKQRYVHHMNINVYNLWYEKCRLEICPNFTY